MFRGSVKSTGYPLHSPVSPFPFPPVRHRVPSQCNWTLMTRCIPANSPTKRNVGRGQCVGVGGDEVGEGVGNTSPWPQLCFLYRILCREGDTNLTAKTCSPNHDYHTFKERQNYRRESQTSLLHKRTSGCRPKVLLDTAGDPIISNYQ